MSYLIIVVESLKEGLKNFDRKIKDYATEDSVLTGIETRTSAPVTLKRTENLESETLKGLYPAGEGAGFAGGIISAAVDGMKVAEKIMKKYKPFKINKRIEDVSNYGYILFIFYISI